MDVPYYSRKLTKRTSIYLWEFLLELLEDKECADMIHWVNKRDKEFLIDDPDEIAKLWGMLKGRPLMNKKKLCRAIRYYYTSKLVTKVLHERIFVQTRAKGECLCT